MCDLIHLEGAEAIASYGSDFYAGIPCVTVNRYGAGKAVYIGSKLPPEGVDAVMSYSCGLAGIEPVLETPAGVEAMIREDDIKKLLFLVNNNEQEKTVKLPDCLKERVFGPETTGGEVTLAAYGSAVYALNP